MKYDQFIFKNYEFNRDSGELFLYYGYDDKLDFCEKYKFNFEFVDYNTEVLDRAAQILFYLAGVSYYKMYMASEIIIRKGQVDPEISSFLSNTYQRGLGEFFYMNNLTPETEVVFPVNNDSLEQLNVQSNEGQLVGLGGGKDSLLSVELLRGKQTKSATWSLNHKSQMQPLVDRAGTTHFWVEREWDPQIEQLNKQDAMNGHIPISAIFSCVGLIVSILSGYRDNIVSNESSASEPTLNYQGVDINHQYSKSLQYEQDFQTYLHHGFGDSLRYYSLLRPLTELHIAKLFAAIAFDKYKDVFSSCNRAFRRTENHMSWCGECAKCAFTYLIFSPFIKSEELNNLWGGKNLLLDPTLEHMYLKLLGIQGDKPFDCVGEVKEARAAMRLAQEVYPELNKYEFELPEDYNYLELSPDSMPESVRKIVVEAISAG